MMRTTALLTLLVLLTLPLQPAFAEEEPVRTAKDILKDLKDRDRGVKLLAIAECGETQDTATTTQLTKMLKEKDFEVRAAVIEALAARKAASDQKRAATALAHRLAPLSKGAANVEEYLAVIAALDTLAQPCSIRALLDMEIEEDQETAKARIMAVAKVPSKEAIDALIAFASKGRNRGTNNQREFATKALQAATGQKFNRDMDKWRSWWKEHRDTFDFEMMKAERDEQRRAEEERRAQREERDRRREERRRE
jgi:HEAT repeat protein